MAHLEDLLKGFVQINGGKLRSFLFNIMEQGVGYMWFYLSISLSDLCHRMALRDFRETLL